MISFLIAQHRGIDVGIHQQIGAVADEDDGVPVRLALELGDARAPAAGDLVAHAGKAELDIDRADIERAPVGGDFGRQPARRCHHTVARIAQRVDHADRLRVGIGPVAVRHVAAT
jgi:hypothetical protein